MNWSLLGHVINGYGMCDKCRKSTGELHREVASGESGECPSRAPADATLLFVAKDIVLYKLPGRLYEAAEKYLLDHLERANRP